MCPKGDAPVSKLPVCVPRTGVSLDRALGAVVDLPRMVGPDVIVETHPVLEARLVHVGWNTGYAAASPSTATATEVTTIRNVWGKNEKKLAKYLNKESICSMSFVFCIKKMF